MTIRNVQGVDLDDLRRQGITHLILREREWSQYLARLQGSGSGGDAVNDPLVHDPEVVWRTPQRFEPKNRWLREKIVVLRL